MDPLTAYFISQWKNDVLPQLTQWWLTLSVPLLGLALLVSLTMWITKKN